MLKTSRKRKQWEKNNVQGNSIRLSADFFSRNFAGQKKMAWYIQNAKKKKKKKKLPMKNILPGSYHSELN